MHEELPMSSVKPLQILAVCAMVGGLLPTYATAGDCASDVCTADETITSQVLASYQQHAELAVPNAIRVQTRGQVVYLHGHVSSGMQRDEAISLAKQVPNVKRVVASIRTDNTGG
jgi:osmotically-inducible protein OsmY